VSGSLHFVYRYFAAPRLTRRFLIAFEAWLLTLVAVVVWALGNFRAITLPGNFLDFIGGAAVGLAIGMAVAWTAERT